MAKFPSQRKITYQTGDMGIDSFAALTSGGVSGDLNIPKDLSLLNRRGYASTTRKGVPLVYRCKVDFFMQNEDGKSFTTAGSGSGQVDPSVAAQQAAVGMLRLQGCQNNWVMRNAAVKFHAARHEMFKAAGVKKRHLGAYANEIRYNYDSNADNWLVPIDGNGDAFAGGTWDVSTLSTERDQDVELKLVGTGINEDGALAATALQIGFSYLSSRAQPPADSNLESSASPAQYSVLNRLLSPTAQIDTTVDNVVDEAQDKGDNPPYDEWASADTNHDITESVELGRIVVGGLSQITGSMIVDIPFGLARPQTNVYSPGYDLSDSEPFEGLMQVEVLDIFEMQG